jgi:plasmid stabilization system protein ParE
MAEIRWTAEARAWLRRIHDYIARDNPEAATRVIEEIHEKALPLRSFPESGHRYFVKSEQNIRILLYGHYRIAYLIKPDGNIDILGVFHGAMDIEEYL